MSAKFKDEYIYLDTYTLQQDMRIRLPKIIEQNMDLIKGKTSFDIFLKNDKTEIVLRIHEKVEGER